MQLQENNDEGHKEKCKEKVEEAQNKKRKEDFAVELDKLSLLSDKEFEGYIAVFMDKVFSYETKVIGKAGDNGVDVVCTGVKNLLVQVKHTAKGKKQGTKALQEVRGGQGPYEEEYSLNFELVAATNTHFNENAEIQSLRNPPVQLIDFTFLKENIGDHIIMKSEVIKKIS